MPNIASILKEEISRIARKEVRGEVAALKKASTTHRTEIAALKRRTSELEKQVKALTRIRAKSNRVAVKDASPKVISFSAKGLASQRKRLDLSAGDCGLLVGASGQAIYNWESGKSRPRDAYLDAIAELKSLGKKQVTQRLAALKVKAAAV